MKRSPQILAWAAAAALVMGCSNGTSLVPTAATATFSGAVTGTATVVAVGGVNTGNTSVTFAINNSTSTYPLLTFEAQLSGTSLQTGTFTNTSASVVQATTVVQQTSSSGPTWEQSTVAQTGSFSLTISSTGGSVTQNGTTVWSSPQGTLTAVLPAVPGSAATGTVNVSVTF